MAKPEIREARDYTGHLRPMPTPAPAYTRRAVYEDGVIELWKRSGNAYAIVYGLQIDTGLDYARAAAKLGEAMLHAAQCEGKLD